MAFWIHPHSVSNFLFLSLSLIYIVSITLSFFLSGAISVCLSWVPSYLSLNPSYVSSRSLSLSYVCYLSHSLAPLPSPSTSPCVPSLSLSLVYIFLSPFFSLTSIILCVCVTLSPSKQSSCFLSQLKTHSLKQKKKKSMSL